MAVNARWRRDEFSDTFLPLQINNEPHTIEFIEEIGLYGFFADESIQLRDPKDVTVITDNTAAIPFTENAKTDPPDSGEFRVSYDAEGFENSGFINCNASDDQVEVLLTYHGLGTINHPNFRLNRDFFLPGTAQVEVDLIVQRDLIVERNFSMDATGDEVDEISKDVTLSDDSDLALVTEHVVKTYFDTRKPFRNFLIIDTSQTWIKPADVTQIYIEASAAGGGGSGSDAVTEYSGFGGGQGEIRKGLFTVASDVIITIGAGGISGAVGSNGGNGGNTIVGALMTCNGGQGGQANVKGGDSGTGGTGGLLWGASNGNPGSRLPSLGATDLPIAGKGGGELGGNGGFGSGVAGANGKRGCGGGGGSVVLGSSSQAVGGVGGKGYVIIWY